MSLNESNCYVMMKNRQDVLMERLYYCKFVMLNEKIWAIHSIHLRLLQRAYIRRK